MRRGAYYNEHDPFAAAWLRNLISAGHNALDAETATQFVGAVKAIDDFMAVV